MRTTTDWHSSYGPSEICVIYGLPASDSGCIRGGGGIQRVEKTSSSLMNETDFRGEEVKRNNIGLLVTPEGGKTEEESIKLKYVPGAETLSRLRFG